MLQVGEKITYYVTLDVEYLLEVIDCQQFVCYILELYKSWTKSLVYALRNAEI